MEPSSLLDTPVLGQPLGRYAYRYAPRLWVITAYYNPAGFASRRRNYELFAALLREAGIPLLTVECAFGDQPFDLPDRLDVIKVRGRTPLWQKERLLNLALTYLPRTCDYVVWADCDLVFTNPDWARDTARLLDTVAVAQVFETCNRVPEDYRLADAARDVCTSFTKVVGADPWILRSGNYAEHGHTGYAWAARRELLDRHGLYEHAIAGSADHYMAHAACGDLVSPCGLRMMYKGPRLIEHFQAWAEPFAESARGEIGTVPGEVIHLWHGDLKDRRYSERHKDFTQLAFDPYLDLVANPGRPLELRPGRERSELTSWFTSYFAERREDGARVAA
jgi:hypothetical protein